MSSPLRNSLASIRAQLSALSGPSRFFVTFAIAASFALIFIWVINKIVIYFFVRSYVDELAEAFGFNQYLIRAFVWFTFAAAIVFLSYTFSFSRRKRQIGLAGLLLLVIGQSLLVWYGMRGRNFDREGKAVRCYIVTRDAIRYGDRPGTDPATGRECRQVTPDIAERVAAYEGGKRPQRIVEENKPFFDQATGNPITWFYKSKDGEIELFDLMGFHPDTGEELLPVTKEVVNSWKTQISRRVPHLVNNPDEYGFFDPITGKARLWYRRNDRDSFEFFDRPGFDPQTGEALSVISREVVDDWHSTKNATKHCYIITRDRNEPVRYGNKVGIDPISGRQCRDITPEIVERLREYEKGNRPKKITANAPTFFDLRTGEPVAWYAKTKNGEIEFFDLMGFHPDTGEELQPVTKDVVEEWKSDSEKREEEKQRRPPQQIDLRTYSPFDPKTGQPRVWYWRSDKGEYEFYDNRGYHPRTGEQLAILSKEAIKKWLDETEALQKKRQEEKLQREREEQERAQRLEKEKKEHDALAERKQAEIKLQADRETQAAKLCDQLAANPNDRNRMGDGVAYDSLKTQAAQAVESCDIAVRQSPGTLRFQYQLGRALQSTGTNQNRQRAFDIFKKLVGQRYPSAYDNFGYLMAFDRKNIAEAVQLFRAGSKLGDADSMLSLADMIDKGYASPMGPGETKIDLLARAAQLGHAGAAKAFQEEREKASRAEIERARQEEQTRKVIEMLGGFIQGVQRR